MNLRQIPPADLAIQNRPDSGDDLPTIDLGEVFRLIRSHKLTILGTAVLVVAITGLALAYITPIYSATAYVILDQRANAVVDATGVVAGLSTDPNSIQTQVQVLQSRNLAGRVVDQLNLENDDDFNPPPVPPTWFSQIVNSFKRAPPPGAPVAPKLSVKDTIINTLVSNLLITAQGQSASIAIKFSWIDPVKAAAVANAYADSYVADQLALKTVTTDRTSEWLSDRLSQLSAQTQSAERAVEEYKAKSRLTDMANGASVVQQQLTALNAQLVSAQADLAQQEARFAQMVSMKRSGRTADISQAVASSLISRLREQETELLRQEAEMSSRYGPMHPKMVDLESQKKNLYGKINEEVNCVVETVRNDVEVARARVSSLQRSMAGLTGQLDNENIARVKLGELVSAAASNRAQYEAFLSRFKEIEGRGEIQVSDARVASPAIASPIPSFPNKIVFLGAAFPAGLILGFILAIISRSLEAGFTTRPQVENYLSLPVLAVVPELSWFRRNGMTPSEKVIVRPKSSFAELMRALQIALMLGKSAKQTKVVVLTSSVPSEGKTTAAVSLARIVARSGKRVIVLDADLRRPQVHKTMKAIRGEYGIVELLNGEKSLAECLCKDPISQAQFLATAKSFSNPSDVLASDRMVSLVHELSAACDLLIIDSPPVLPVNDARIIALLADAVVFVIRWRYTTRAAVLQAVQLLNDVSAPLMGVVLARTDEEQFLSDSYGGQRYQQFKKYYGE